MGLHAADMTRQQVVVRRWRSGEMRLAAALSALLEVAAAAAARKMSSRNRPAAAADDVAAAGEGEHMLLLSERMHWPTSIQCTIICPQNPPGTTFRTCSHGSKS